MLEIIMGEYVPDTLAYVLWESKLLEIFITNADLPVWSPLKLITTDWKGKNFFF